MRNRYRVGWIAALLWSMTTLILFTPAFGAQPLQLSLWPPAARTSTLTGEVVAEESNLPLTDGTVTAAGLTVPIVQGRFVIEDLPLGRHRLTVEGPFRAAKELTAEITRGGSHIEIHMASHFSPEDIDMLARITRAEAEGECEQGRIAVAATVLNRVLSDRYPSSITAVVHQRLNGRYQYSPVRDGRIRLSPRPEDYHAAYQALTGQDPSEGATGFFAPAKTKDPWVHAQQVTTVIGGHRFFAY